MMEYAKPDHELKGWNVGEIWQPIIGNFVYEDVLAEIRCNNQLSSIPPTEIMKTVFDLSKDQFYEFIKKDCIAKIQDVEATNKACSSVSAFMSISALIGFFAKLFCGKNAAFHKTYNCQEGHDDNKSYLYFVNKYLLQEKVDFIRTDGLANVLYKMVRCGLLHGVSVGSRQVSNIKVYLSHRDIDAESLSSVDRELKRGIGAGVVKIVLNALSICKELQNLIPLAFDSATEDERNSIMAVYVEDPPIIFLKHE